MTSAEDQAIIDAALKAQRDYSHSTTTVAPTGGVITIQHLKSQDNWRAFFHQAIGVVVPALVAMDIVSQNESVMWLPFLFALLDNILSVGTTGDRIRRAVFAGFGVLQAGGLVTALVSNWHPEYLPIVGAVMAITSAFLARFYSPTTTMEPIAQTYNAA